MLALGDTLLAMDGQLALWEIANAHSNAPRLAGIFEALAMATERWGEENYGPDKRSVNVRTISEGDTVKAKAKGWSKFYKGQVTRVNRDGTYDIRFNDGECQPGVRADHIEGGGGRGGKASDVNGRAEVYDARDHLLLTVGFRKDVMRICTDVKRRGGPDVWTRGVAQAYVVHVCVFVCVCACSSP